MKYGTHESIDNKVDDCKLCTILTKYVLIKNNGVSMRLKVNQNIFDIKIPNGMNCIVECNLPHDIIKPSKRTKYLNSHYSPILHGCMNPRNSKTKFSGFQILLYSVCSSMIVTRRIISKLNPEKFCDAMAHTSR